MKLDNFLQKLISFLFLALFFLVPLFFTPVNSELFEFNKIILVYGFTILVISAWIGRMIFQRRIIFKRTFFDIPLLLFLISQFASTLLSIDPHTSIFGYYSRFNGGLLSTLCYLLLYWACVANCEVKDVYKVIKVSLISATIISIYGILEHFGHSFSCLLFVRSFDVSCWVQRVQERVFATLGQPNWLAAYLIVLTPLTWWLALSSKFKIQNSKLKLKIKSFLPFALSALFLICLLFTQSRSGFLGFLLSFTVFWGVVFFLSRHQLKTVAKPFFLFAICYLLFAILFGSPFPQINKYLYYKSYLAPTPTTRLTTQNPQPLPVLDTSDDGGISQSSDIRKILWKGAIDIFKHYPAFGSGVETFAYSYYNFRPVEHNLVSEWDFLYNKAHNEYLNFLSTTGIFGLGTYLIFIGAFVIWNIIQIKSQSSKVKNTNQNLKTKDEKSLTFNFDFDFCTLIFALFSGWLSILVTNFFGFSVVVTSLYFFLIPALCVVLSSRQPDSQPTTHPRLTTHNPSPLPFIPLILTSFFLIRGVVNYWRADYFYAKGQKSSKQSDYPNAYQNLYQAKNLFPNEPVYLSDISSVTANLALMSNTQKEASATGELRELAISYSDQARKISPKNLNVLKSRVRVFYTLSLIEPKYLNDAIKTMLEAIQLAPTDPKLVYNLGLLYAKTGDSKLTIQTIEKAVQLKPNYVDARNALALFYEDAGEKQKALEQLEILTKIAPENKKEFEKKIEQLR